MSLTTRSRQARKAQTSMVLIVILIIVFIAAAVTLFSIATNVSQEDYMDTYANNLLLAIMKTDTGYTDNNCKLVSDAAACAYIDQTWTCGTSGMTCRELANSTITDYMKAFELISKNYRYLFVVTRVGFYAPSVDQFTLMFGDESLLDYKGKKRVSTYAIQKSLQGNYFNLKVQLYIARK